MPNIITAIVSNWTVEYLSKSSIEKWLDDLSDLQLACS